MIWALAMLAPIDQPLTKEANGYYGRFDFYPGNDRYF